jgi:hypothetical protein
MTTSNLRFVITPSARIENGTAQVFMSEDLVKTLRTEQNQSSSALGAAFKRRRCLRFQGNARREHDHSVCADVLRSSAV